MEDVVVSNYNISGGEGDLPTENVTLSYSKVTYTYDGKNKEQGSVTDGVQPIEHDLKENKVS